MNYKKLTSNKTVNYVAISIVGFVLLVAMVFISLNYLFSDTPNKISQSNDESSGNVNKPGEGSGIPLSGSVLDLIGSVVSTRNLSGLQVQVNQLDICTAPDVTAYVALTNKEGKVFKDVRADDFTVTVDGKKQENFEFSRVAEKDLPLNTVLTLDRSGSMAGDPMAQLKAAAKRYIDKLQEGDKAAVMSFNTEVKKISGLTSNKTKLKKAVNSLDPVNDTALYDAMSVSAGVAPECGRKAVLLMTDGNDTASTKVSLKKAISNANKTSTPVFVIGLKSKDFNPPILKKMAEETGAQYFEASSPQALSSVYDSIDRQLSGQYVFQFKIDIPKTKKEHRLSISAGVTGGETKSSRSFIY